MSINTGMDMGLTRLGKAQYSFTKEATEAQTKFCLKYFTGNSRKRNDKSQLCDFKELQKLLLCTLFSLYNLTAT